MKSVLTESKPQLWRAVAVFESGQDCLLYLGASSPQIRAGYLRAFNDVLDAEERDQVKAILLQRWHGAPDAGRWVEQAELSLPKELRLARSA
ncbi:MAG TPA: hypothetical protein PKD86_11315 [Gemmatales bacterium]|nr:hypothetical protein [Gemmatales bacterium]HMP59931.1 hypothetical protein [Gemmatales bacterium]